MTRNQPFSLKVTTDDIGKFIRSLVVLLVVWIIASFLLLLSVLRGC